MSSLIEALMSILRNEHGCACRPFQTKAGFPLASQGLSSGFTEGNNEGLCCGMSQGRLGQGWTRAPSDPCLPGDMYACLSDSSPVHRRPLSLCSPSCRQWWRQLTTSSSRKPWTRGGTWLRAISSGQPPCCLTPWRRVLSCWRITFWRLTSSGRTQTISVSGLCWTAGPETRGQQKREKNVSLVA